MRAIVFFNLLFMLILPQADAQQNMLNQDDPAGKLTKMTEKHFLIDTSREPGDQLVLKHYIVTKFNKNGNRVEDLEFDANNNLFKKNSYENTDGKRQKLVITDAKAKLIKTVIYTYNEKGLLENDQSYDAGGKPEKTLIYVYDDKGLLRENYSYLKAGEFEMKYSHIYDYKGNIDKTLCFTEGGNLVEERQYKYNENGQVISELVKNELGEILKSTTFQYVTDNKKNWTEKTVLVDKHPVNLIKREIVYN